MSQADEEVQAPRPGSAVVRLGQVERADDWADLRQAVRKIQRGQPVLIGALVLVVAQVIWRAQFLSHMFFLREDFFNSDLAVESHFGWGYLTYIGAGHLMIGERAIVWVLVRMSLYNWDLAMAVTLAFTLAAGLAAFKMLRTLFGERPVILVLLAIYLLIPLTISSMGWWTEALESIPLQLATFMAVDAQVRYVRTGSRRQLAAAVFWVIFGLIFFEKGLILPFLLFAVSAFVVPCRSWLSGARIVLIKYWRAWLIFAVLLVAYAVVLLVALRASSFVQPHAPNSAHSVITFVWALIKDSLLPGAIGGPWRWYPLPGNWYALAAAPKEFDWLALIVAIAVVGVSIWRRPVAWRAWAIFAGWLVLADMAPVIIARLDYFPTLYALDTHYVADAVPVLVLCLGLAVLPVIDLPAVSSVMPDMEATEVRAQRRRGGAGEQFWRPAAAAMLAIFVIGSIWSNQAYSNRTTGLPAAIYIDFARAAIKQASPGEPVLASAVPPDVSYQAADDLSSRVVGDMDPGKLLWILHPDGTIDGLRMFGTNGVLDEVWVYGTSSGPGPKHGCWPTEHGSVKVGFVRPSPYLTTLVRIGYIWGSSIPGVVIVHFGSISRTLSVKPGLHTGYVPVTGSVTGMSVNGLDGNALCIGDAEAGNPGPVVARS